METHPVEFDLKGVSVMLAMPINRDMPWQTTKSLVETAIQLEHHGIYFDIQYVVGSSIVEVARSKVADVFMRGDKSRLFMLDSDQAWKAKDFMRLLALSTKMSIVCGAYPCKKDPLTFMISHEGQDVTSNEWGCIPVAGLGLGFTVVHREVIAALSEDAPRIVFPGSDEAVPHIFRCDIVDNVFRGEDIAFFADARKRGHTAWLDPSLQIGHVGAKEYRGSILDAMDKV